MKKIIFLMLLIFPLSAIAQTGHPVTISVMNRKGRVPDDRNIIAYVKGTRPVVHNIGHNGKIYIPDVPANDTVALVIRDRIYEFKAQDAHNMEIQLGRNERVSTVTDNGVRLSSNSYMTVAESPAVSVNEMNNPSQYSSLADYLMGRIPGLVVMGGPGNYQVYLDGEVPLIMLDGMRINSFNAANSLVIPSDIQSVTVDRNGIIYGTSGMNGVLIITTKS